MASKMTRAEKERRQAVKENEKAKKKKEKSESSSSSKLGKLIGNMIGKPEKEKKTFAEAFEENTKKLDIGREKPTVSKKEKVGETFSVDDEKRYNPLTKTAVRTPERDITVGNIGRTREELERRKSTRDLAQMTSDDWLKKGRESVALKESEKAGVGLGTIQHGTLNKNAELFMQNWNKVPQGNKVDAAIQIIYTYGVNDQNRALVMSAFNGASTFDKRKMMDAVVQTDGWSNVAYEMKNAVSNAPDSKQALMQQISEDMNVRNGNYLDTFQRAANKGIIDQNTLQQKEDRVIADWAKENYNIAEALKYRTLQKEAARVNELTDIVAFGVSDLLQAGQQGNVLDGINPFEGIGDTKGLGNKVAKFGTNVLHDLFRLAGINVSVFSKTFLTQDDVDDIAEKLMSITEPYHEAVRNNMVAMENGNLSEAEKELVEVYGMVIEQIPSIIMSLVASPAAGLATTGMTAGGKYARSAYEQGATLEQAVHFGLAGAAAEVGSEKLFTGFGYFGKGLSSKLLTDTTRKLIDGSTFKNSVAADMLKRVAAGGGEATEEMIVEIITPYLERSTYDPSADGATMEEILRSGGLGFVVAQILGLPANALGVTGKVLEAKDTKAQEDILRGMVADAVKAGKLSEADAANVNEQIKDIRSGKGTLTASEMQKEVKTTGENLDAVYANFDEAREAMQAEAKGKQNGESVSARFMQDGEAKLWTAKVMNGGIVQVQQGITTGKEKEQYAAKAQKVASATNTAERTGYQLNVRDEIVKEVSAISKAINREVEFISDSNAAMHGYVQNDKIYVNVNSTQSPARAVVAHEMTHMLEGTSSYARLRDMVYRQYGSSVADKRAEILANYEASGVKLDQTKTNGYDEVDAELMAMFVEEKLLTDSDNIRQIVREDRTLAQKIVDWINKVIQKISGSKEQRFLIEARDVWNKALKEGQDSATSIEGEQITSDAVEEIRYSQGNDKKLMDKADARNHATHAVEQEILDEAREARTNIKDKYSDLFIADSVSERKSPLVGNDSYAGSLDSTTICSRSLTLEAIVELVAKKFDRPLTNAEAIVVAQELMEYTGDRAECLYCYQANAKRGYEDALGAFIRERRTVIDNHRNGMDKDTNFKLMMNFNFEKGTWGKKPTDAAKDRFNTYIKIAEGKLTMAPASGMLNTRTLYASIADKKNSPAIIEQYKQARTYAQGAVKAHGRVYYAVYNGQILRVKQSKIDEWNRTYGLRMYSFSDFSPAFILENMQMVTDAAVRGLRMLAYTKEPEFVSIFGDTGMAINISVAGVPDGNGGYHSDGMQGMDWETAKALRDRYPAAGTVYVAKDDAEVEWAMSQDWIDTVIPFHISYGSGMMQRSMGWTNYSGQQSEKKMPGWTKELKTTIYPSEHQNNKETYLRLCEENLLTPKFPKWKDHPDYMKLVNETRLAPEEMAPVQPIFNVEEAEESLDHFAKAGGYNPILGGSEANRDYIVEDIAERVKERAPEVEARDRKYSVGKITEEDTVNNIKYVSQMDPVVNITGQEFPRVENENGNDRILEYMNGFDLYNSDVGDIIFNRRSIKSDIGHGIGRLKMASYAAVPYVLNEGKVVTYHEDWKGRGYASAVIVAPITIGNKPYFEGIVVHLTDRDGNRFYLHEVWLEEDKKIEQHRSEPGGSKTVDSGDAILSINNILQQIISVKYGYRTAEDLAHEFMEADPYDTRYSIGRPTDTKAERRDAEEAMKVYDDLLEEEIENAPELTANEKREIDRSMVMSKEEAQAELDRLVKQRKAKREKLSRTLSENLKLAGKLDNSDKRRTANNRYKLNDEKIRKERIRIAQEWYDRNKKKPAPGSAESMYLKNRSARQLMDEFRRGVMTYLVEHGEFIPTESGGVVLDEQGTEVAKRDTMTGEWDVSFARNDYTPSAGLVHLAELEGFDVDVFYTIYSHIRYLKTAVNKERKGQYHREDIVEYIVSLNLTQKQKDFLYLDVAGYASSTRPIFLPGGRVKEEKGNQRGRLIKSLDNIAIDMFAGVTSGENLYDSNHRITNNDVLNFANEIYGEGDSKAKDEFLLFFIGRLITYTDKMMESRAVERTNLLTDKPKEADPYKAKILRIYRNLKKELIAEGEAFERMSDMLNNPLIRARYYDAKKSLGIANEMINGRHQRNINGEAVGKGLHKIFEPVFKADEKANNSTMITELTLLVNCRHDIYRMKYETEYTGYTKEECEAHIKRISKAYPNLVEVADELVEYGRNLLQMCVDCGRISEGDYNYFIDKYPYYVPTFRLLGNQYYDRAGNVVKRGNDVLHKVKGGTQPDVLPLYDQLVRRTNEIVKACKKNQLATELAKAYRDPKSAEFISDVQETMRDEGRDETIDRLGLVEDVGLKQRQENGTDNIIPWYCAGVQHDIIISDTNMLYGWDRINYRMSEGETLKVLRKLNSMRRAVLTQYNPTFWLTNHFKDVGDMFLYNQHAQRLPKYYALAWKTMVSGKAKDGKNRDYLEEYLAHGMSQTSIFEYDLSNAGRRTRKMKAKAVAMIVPKGFNELNFIVEQVPRLAVYMETVDRLETQRANGDNTYTNEEIKTIAGYQASDATLNFGRSGTAIKNLNTYGVTFLNAGVQGLDRARRMVTQIKDGNKQSIVINVFGLVFKSVLFGLGFGWIQDWLFGGDDEFAKDFRKLLYGDHADKVRQEYLEMADYQRLNYFIFKWPTEDGNGIWLRILPKSRLQTMMYSHVYNGTKLAKDEIDGWDMIFTQWDMLNETIFPASPLNENILGPILDIKENKDAWGDEIISEYENKGEGFSYLEYDEDTTDLSMAIAELAHRLTADDDTGMSRLDISPKKMDYLLEQYFGSWADFVMPLFDYKDINIKENSLNALNSLVKKFYIDPTFSNRLAGDYYELSDLYQNVSEAYEEDTPYAVASDIFVTVNTQLKPLREASKEIKRSKSMTKGEALAYLDDIISQAEMYDTDLFDIKEYRETIYRSSDKELSRKERTELARVITDQMNQIYRTATSDAKALQEYASANYYGKDGNTDLYKEWYQNNKSAEWQITKITANSDSAKEDWEAYSEIGGDAQSFVDFYNFYSRTNSTYDKNGDQVRGQQKKDKCVKYIRSLDISADLKEQLYLSVGGWSEKKMPRFKDGSELTMDIDMELSHPLGEAGEVSHSFMVDNNGHTQIKVAPGTAVGAAMVGSVDKIVRSEKYGDSIFIKSTDKNGNTIVIQYYGLEEVGGNHEGGAKKYDYIEAGDMIGKAGKDGLKFKITVNGKPVDAADYLDLGKAGTINEEGYTTTKIGEEERKDDESGSSGGGSGGGRGGRGGSGGGSSSFSTSGRNSTAFDSVKKIGEGSSPGRGVMLPTASQVAEITGRSTEAPTYAQKGVYLPKASDYNTYTPSFGGSVATTPQTARTGRIGTTYVTPETPETQRTWRSRDSRWDENILS